MNLNILKPHKALNKAFLKVGPHREEIEKFKTNLITLIEQSNHTESEEHHKNLVIDFLKKTYYDPNHFVNTKGRQDLVIHNGKDAKSTVGVIVEAKKPSSKTEMLTKDNINKKALQELVLYFLRERITAKNLEVKNLVVTNTFEWFVFDATLFDKLFAQDKGLVKQFTDFEEGRLSDTKTDFFYKSIAEPFIAKLDSPIDFTYFDIRDFDKQLRNTEKKDDNDLVALFKILSPEHLLKLPFSNDSNSLDKAFYNELLHIIGLTETKDGGKKLIGRKKEGDRNTGSLLENAIIQLDDLDKLSRLSTPSQFGETHADRLFNVGLELSITWVNRILFLKLLEAQLIAYHKGDKSYAFLNADRIKNYDDLNSLFFAVLAKKPQERNEDVKKAFAKVPYLNSSLFEMSTIEHDTIAISNLRDEKVLPILSSTVLKDNTGKKRTGELNALTYFFEFLNAYDFSSEGSEEIQEENKQLINASVLGLIFEKINGYKDGSFFTPGFITMYMCRETIRRAVLQKFKEAKGWECETIDQLYDKIEDRKEANALINSLKICDPAVGSGHFLVSALNEIIAIKSDLKILSDRDGKRLKEYVVEVVNDELIVTDEDGKLFEYLHTNKESQRVQETLFHEKQTIIENCLFGVDINPNSVKICRLRLWIELLKNAYYTDGVTGMELETLPNIDINIKCGNSLVSRFALDVDLKQALKKSKWSIESYKIAIQTYQNAQSKEEKREIEKLIDDIKNNFRSEISDNDPKVKRQKKVKEEIFFLPTQYNLFEMSKQETILFTQKMKELTDEDAKLEQEINEIKNNKIYKNAFEWRFEFPEILNSDGDFVGFDIIIGNPPYIQLQKDNGFLAKLYADQNYLTYFKTGDIYCLFYEKAFQIMNKNSLLSFITPNTWLQSFSFSPVRTFLSNNFSWVEILIADKIFDEATVDTHCLILKKNKSDKNQTCLIFKKQNTDIYYSHNLEQISTDGDPINIESSPGPKVLFNKLKRNNLPLSDYFDVYNGVKPFEKGKGRPPQTSEIMMDKPFVKEGAQPDNKWKPLLRGSLINKYVNLWNNNYWILYGEWLAAPRNPVIFSAKEKIVVRQTGDSIIATIIESDIICRDNLHVILPKGNFDLKCCLGILNSKLMDFFYAILNPEKGEALAQVKKGHVEQLPLPKADLKLQTSIISKVNRVISIKQSDIAASIEVEKKEIDMLVYQLYDLTEEEIKIVEGIS